jgi:hypothetical protein
MHATKEKRSFQTMAHDVRGLKISGNVIALEGYKSARLTSPSPLPAAVSVEVASNGEVGDLVGRYVRDSLTDLGHAVREAGNPDWVISIIAFSYGERIELSIVMRRLCWPGTVDGKRQVQSRGNSAPAAGTASESLQFHGLFGVAASELKPFLQDFIMRLDKAHIRQAHTEQR